MYRYTDIWGNTRITYADDNDNGQIDGASEIRREQNYYPFGLEHKGYNNVSYGVKNNLKTYQGQEFTEDLELNTHEWKFRISDPAIGRFWQVDPLAEDYVYNSSYAFQENKLGMGTELEGLELERFDEGINQIASGASRLLNESTNVEREMNMQGANGSEKADMAQQERISQVTGASSEMAKGAVEASKGATKIVGSSLETAGDAGTVLALATGQVELLPLTEGMSATGTLMNAAVDISDGNEGRALMSAGTSFAFGELGDQAVKASRRSAGEAAVSAGETKTSDAILTGTSMGFGEVFKIIIYVQTGIKL